MRTRGDRDPRAPYAIENGRPYFARARGLQCARPSRRSERPAADLTSLLLGRPHWLPPPPSPSQTRPPCSPQRLRTRHKRHFKSPQIRQLWARASRARQLAPCSSPRSSPRSGRSSPRSSQRSSPRSSQRRGTLRHRNLELRRRRSLHSRERKETSSKAARGHFRSLQAKTNKRRRPQPAHRPKTKVVWEKTTTYR